MNANDLERLGLADDEMVDLSAEADDEFVREVSGLRVIRYSIPEGNVGGYYPELNALIPLWHYDAQAMTPAAKAIPVRIRKGTPIAVAD